MPSNPRLFLNNSIVMVSFRTEEGLPFVPLEFMNEIIWAALAAAQARYSQEVCGLCVEANQMHMLLRVEDPENVPRFVGYLKQETAHAINRLLGRRRKSVWVSDYDAPTILDLDKFLEMYAYCLLNPVKDKLVNSMDHYPGVSTWKMLKRKQWKRSCLRIRRSSITRLDNPARPWEESDKVVRELRATSRGESVFKLSAYSWKQCFERSRDLTDEQAHEMLLSAIDAFLSKLPTATAHRDPNRLTRQSLLKPYTPKKFGKKMICLSSLRSLRMPFIQFAKSLFAKARAVFMAWCAGDLSLAYPPGLFAPHLPRNGNLLYRAAAT